MVYSHLESPLSDADKFGAGPTWDYFTPATCAGNSRVTQTPQNFGSPGRIRTDTERSLKPLPLPSWATGLWPQRVDSNHLTALEDGAPCQLWDINLVPMRGFEPPVTRGLNPPHMPFCYTGLFLNKRTGYFGLYTDRWTNTALGASWSNSVKSVRPRLNC